MTLDEALNLLNNSKPKSNNAFSIQMSEAINVLGVTVRKYQKIEGIVEEWDKDLIDYEGHYGDDYMEKIQEVVEDGKID